jgi:TPR repeat protein
MRRRKASLQGQPLLHHMRPAKTAPDHFADVHVSMSCFLHSPDFMHRPSLLLTPSERRHAFHLSRLTGILCLTSALLLAGCQTPPTKAPAQAPQPSVAPATQPPEHWVVRGQLTPAGVVLRDQGVAQFKASQDAEAFQSWLPLAEAGHAESQFNLAAMLQKGGAVAQDVPAALRWSARAAQGGYAAAHCKQGDLLLALRNDAASRQRAFSAYLKGATQGEMDCMHNTGAFMLNGYAGGRDVGAGMHWLTQAAEAGKVESQFQLGSAHLHGTYALPDHGQARRWLAKAADAGHVNATHDLAYMWENGLGGEPDPAMAAPLYERAAAGGQSRSANNLGLMYRNGRGVPVDFVLAVNHFRQAIELRNTEAMVNLGDMHYLGLGAPADPAQAAALYLQAAEAGLPWGECRLAALLRHGDGVTADVQRADALQTRVLARMPSADCTTPLSRMLR